MLPPNSEFNVYHSPLWWGAAKFVRRKSAIRLTHSDICSILWLDCLIEETGFEYVHVHGLYMLQCYAFGYKIDSARRITKTLMDKGFIVCQDGKPSLRGKKPHGVMLTAQGAAVVALFKETIADRLAKFGDMFGEAAGVVRASAPVRNIKKLSPVYSGLGRGSLYLDAQLYK